MKLKVFKKYIEEKLVKGWIYSFISSFDFLILFVKKLNDNLRLCVNYRVLNRMIIKNRYFISLIIKIMNWIRKVKKFSYINIYNIFHWIYIIEDDEWKTIFRIHYNHFEYLIIFFDLYNILAIFQYYINDILYDFLNEFYVIYLNDIFIYINEIHEDHVKHVHQILQHFLDYDLYIKLKKYKFHIQETRFLNFIISSNDIIMNLEYIFIIINWSIFNSIHDIQVFLEFYNFYYRFIDLYSHEILIIIILFHKISSIFQWISQIQKVFEYLKYFFTQISIFYHFNSKISIYLYINISKSIISDIIYQFHNNNLYFIIF